jgi:hypothetical protein
MGEKDRYAFGRTGNCRIHVVRRKEMTQTKTSLTTVFKGKRGKRGDHIGYGLDVELATACKVQTS